MFTYLPAVDHQGSRTFLLHVCHQDCSTPPEANIACECLFSVQRRCELLIAKMHHCRLYQMAY